MKKLWVIGLVGLCACASVKLYEFDIDGGHCTESHYRHGISPTTVTVSCVDNNGVLVPLEPLQSTNPLEPLISGVGVLL